MMLSRLKTPFCLALALFFSSPLVTAATKAEINAALNSTHIKLENKETSLATLESRLASYRDRQADAQEKLDKAQAELTSANEELDLANSSTSTEASVQQELAQKKIDLAKNGLESRKKRLESTSEKLNSLATELKTGQTEQQTLKIKIATLETQLAAANAAPQPQTQKVAPKPAYTPAPAKVAAAPIAIPEPVAAAPVVTAEKPVEAKPVAPPTEQELYARKEMKTLNSKTKGADTEGYRQYDELFVDANNKHKEELEFLGNNQYYGEIKLPSGNNKLEIINRTFKVNIPKEQNNDMFVIIYDASNRKKARFVIFNKNLLND